jgi:hypothetical protein
MMASENLFEQLPPLERVQYKATMEKISFWTKEETAFYLGISEKRLLNLNHAGLRRVKGVSREPMYARETIMAFLEENNISNLD